MYLHLARRLSFLARISSCQTRKNTAKLGLQRRRSQIFFEQLEARQLLATLYVDNPGDFSPPNPNSGDTVTWNPGTGSQHGGAVSNLTFGTRAFGTIQSAVNAASPGDTIRVGPGTFVEGVNINKQLFVYGNQVGADAQSGRAGAPETIVTGVGNNGVTPFDLTASDVELNGFTIEGATNGNAFGFGILVGAGTSGSLIRDNIVQDNIAGLSLANASTTDQTQITGNLFQNNNEDGPVSGTSIYTDQSNAGGALNDVLIDNNTFLNESNAAVLIGPTVSTSPATGITISRNVMTNDANPIFLFNTHSSTITQNEISASTFSQVVIGGGDNGLTITQNFITNGATSGIRIGDFGGGSANQNITINRNSISGNMTAGINIDAGGYTGGPGSLNAEFNWWDVASGPMIASNPDGTGDAIIDPDLVVDYTPFLTNGTDTQPAVRGFQPSIADVAVSKTGPASAVPGTALTYTIVVTNSGPDTQTGVSVTDNFPAGFTGVTSTSVASGGATGNSAGASGNINDTVTLPAGSQITYNVTGQVSPAATGTLTNTATVTPQSTTFDTNTTNNSSIVMTNLTPQADLSISKSDGVTTVATGSTVTYTIVVSNSGPSAVTGATVADAFPGTLTGVTFTAAGSGGANGFTNGNGNINQMVNLPVGGTVTYTATGTVSGTATGAITNTATVTAPNGTTDTNSANNTSTDTDTVATSTSTADLRITKTDGVTTVSPGGSLTYTIVVSNTGPAAVAGATVTDVFPPNLTNTTFTASGAGGASGFTNGSGNLNQTVNLPVGASITYTVNGTASAATSGAITNTASVTAPAGVADTNQANNVATDTDTVAATTTTTDLGITKTDGVSTVAPGSSLTYTIVVSNTGSSAVSGATVSDVFPATLTGVTFTSAPSGGATGNSGSASGNINDTVTLPIGSTITYTVHGTVSGAATGVISNTATITAPAGVADINTSNNSATDTDTVAASTSTADLSITKTDGVTTATAGGALTYTIVVSNSGPSTVTGATVTDLFPTTFTNVTFTTSPAGGATGATNGSGNINQTVNLPAGSSITYTVSGVVNPNAAGAISNSASVTAPAGVADSNPTNNVATDTDTITPTVSQTDLSISKTDQTTSVAPGSTDTYIIVVTNSGSSTVTGATVTDTFPAAFTGATFTSTPTGGATGNSASGSGNINDTVTLPAGATVTYVVTGTISASATGTISNSATVTPPAGTTDVNPTNNVATDIDTVTGSTLTADLGIVKNDGVTTAAAGSSLTYTIIVSNSGPDAVSGASVADTFPATFTGATFTAAGTGGASGFANGSGNIAQTVNLPAGATITYTVTGTVSPTATGSISNSATVTAPAGVTDANQANNSSTDTDAIAATTSQADLSITKNDGVTTVSPGGTLTYTIVVSNVGTTTVSGATVTDMFPPPLSNVSFTTAESGGASGAANGAGNINQTVTLPVGSTITYTVTATVSPTASGAVSNTATVTTPTGVADLNPTNNIATDTDAIFEGESAIADLSITKTDGVTTATAGSALTYTIVVSNTGGTNVTGAMVTDMFPATFTGVTYTTMSSGGATGFANGSGNINQTVNLPTGATITYTVTGTVSPNTAGAIANTAIVSTPAGVTDNNPANNVATDVDTVVLPQTDLQITKTDGVTSVNAGSPLTYTITVTNAGPTAVTGATVADTFPAAFTGATFTATGGGGASGFANGSGNINQTVNLPVNGSVIYTVSGTVSPTATGNLSNSATVTGPAGVTEINTANNTATDTDTIVAAQPDLTITKDDSPDPVTAGQNLTYTITVNNAGTATAQNVQLSDTLPGGTTFVLLTSPAGWSSTTPVVGGTGTITSTRTSLAAGASPQIFTLVVKTNASLASGTDTLSNTATVTTTTTESNPNNDSATATTSVNTTADVSITKTENHDTVAPGDSLTYTIVVHNNGPSDAQSVTASDTLPDGTTFVTGSQTSGPTFTLTSPNPGDTGTVMASTNTLAAGATATFMFTVQVGAGVATGTTISNTASVSTTTNDPNLTNDSSTVNADVEAQVGLPVCNITSLNSPGAQNTAVIQADADNPGDEVLLVTGTTKNDVLIIEPRPLNMTQVRVKSTGKLLGIFSSNSFQHIVAYGLAGNDTIVVDPRITQSAILFGGDGNDALYGGSGTNQISGGNGNDVIFGGNNNDTLCGDAGNDVLYGGNGNDVLFGEAGNDVLYGQNGNDQLLGGDGNDVLYGGLGDDQLYGQNGNDTLYGDAGNDIVVGGAGNDKLFGSIGRDLLIGGTGSDQLYGEGDDDILIGGSTTYDENPSALSAIRAEWTSGNNYNTRVNNLRFGGGGANGATTLNSSSVIDDGAADTLYGGGGQDWFFIGNKDKTPDRAKNEMVN